MNLRMEPVAARASTDLGDAIQKGLGRALFDMSAFVGEQRSNVPGWRSGKLMTPVEHVYVPADAADLSALETGASSRD
jgi:hypothetical protein